MTSCLHILSGQFHLLVDTLNIREALEIDGDVERGLHGRRLWRGISIPVLDLREFFGEDTHPTPLAALIYEESENGEPVMLLFDRIFGLLHTDESSFMAVPRSSGRITDYVDGLIKDAATGQLLFHLKQGAFKIRNCSGRSKKHVIPAGF